MVGPATLPGLTEGPVYGSRKMLFVHSEVAAIREGRVVALGLAGQPSNVQAALQLALDYLEKNYEWIATFIETELGMQHPYIDLRTKQRPQDTGEPYAEGESRNVDLIFHTPPECDAAFFAPSMILATIIMLWRLPSLMLARWNVVANLTRESVLYGYPNLNYYYKESAMDNGIDTFLVSQDNAKQLNDAAKKKRKNLKRMGVRVLGFQTMDDMVRWAIAQLK